jgi:hypothetical protein
VLLGEATHGGGVAPARAARGCPPARRAGDDLFGQPFAASAAANKVQVEHSAPAGSSASCTV